MEKRTIGIGHQDFEKIKRKNLFYVDKTNFIKEWWEREDDVTLITRPRRFGKTLNMSMMNCFFSNQYENRGDLFEGLSIWNEEKYHKIQGTYPVIFLSFANIKETNFPSMKENLFYSLIDLYEQNRFLLKSEFLGEKEKEYFKSISVGMSDVTASLALKQLSNFLNRHYGKKVLIFLDEYDTPMQEAYINGYWKELTTFIRTMFNNTFKTNPYLERAILTGITRVSKESIFSDLNNLNVVTTTSDEYADSFGFTEQEVFAAMDEYGYENKEEVKHWYDGFIFGKTPDIYNPWSIINFLAKGKLKSYWANSSSNGLISSLLRKGSINIKKDFEQLLLGNPVVCRIDEEIIYDQLDRNENAIWSLLLASGYLKLLQYEEEGDYELALTNYEVKKMFERMIDSWFQEDASSYNEFIKALMTNNVKAMNRYMNRIALATFSSFDTGNRPSEQTEPERFYHGFVLGLLVELKDRYQIKSNRESGFGRYDVMMIPKNDADDGIILEFKVLDEEEGESSLNDTIREALKQIEDKKYEQELVELGITKERIRKYGFAFQGKTVLIGKG